MTVPALALLACAVALTVVIMHDAAIARRRRAENVIAHNPEVFGLYVAMLNAGRPVAQLIAKANAEGEVWPQDDQPPHRRAS